MPEKNSTVVALLLIPLEGDPLGLLAGGVCGSRPPHCMRAGPMEPWHPGGGYNARPEDGDALVLAWKGEVVPEGTDRAARCAAVAPGAVFGVIPSVLDGDAAPRAIAALGTLILLDSEGREVTL